jgi:hypothetical protein
MKKRTTISMKHSLTIAALCVALGATANELNAQDYRYAASYNAGGAWFSPLNSGAGQGTDLKFDLGWIMGLQFEQWLGSGRTGWRLGGTNAKNCGTLRGVDRAQYRGGAERVVSAADNGGGQSIPGIAGRRAGSILADVGR